MKIGISGAANCGKTRMAERIAKDLGLPIIDERFEDIQKSLSDESHPEEKLETFVSMLEEKHQLEKKNASGFVADRTPIDLFVFFCSLPQPLLNAMSLEKANEFHHKARSYSEFYDYIIFPPWGVVSYSELGTGKAGFCHPRMNPWTNFSRHMSFFGTAIMWVPKGKILQPPASVVLEDRVTDWFLKSAAENRKHESKQ